MNVLLYALAAVAAGVLAIRAPLGNRGDPVRRAYVVLASSLCLCYLAFTFYLLPGLSWFKYAMGVSGAWLPPAFYAFVEAAFPRGDGRPSATLRRLQVLSPSIAAGFLVLDVALFREQPRASIAEVGLGLYVFVGLLTGLHRLWELRSDASNPSELARLRYFLALSALSVGFSAGEALARSFVTEGDSALSWLTRPAVVQGALPPVGAVFSVIFLYFTFQSVTASRLLDLGQMMSRLAAVSAAALVLVAIDALSAAALLGEYPYHGAAQVFMASALFLLAYEPISRQLETWLAGLINPRGQRFREVVREIDDALTRTLTIQQFTDEIQSRLLASGRASRTGLYLWDEDSRSYRLYAEQGQREEPALVQVSRQPFTDGFAMGARAYVRGELQRQIHTRAGRTEEWETRLRLMTAMDADVALPFTSGDVVFGWLTLRDDSGAAALTDEELTRVLQLAARAAVVLENLQSFEKLKEEHRLAALGTMAAGLAHEIRNPLAGIKGAAQYLQGGLSGPDAEMIQVIISEVDRLSEVVSQFLDYARPLQVQREPTPARALVAHVAGVMRASGLPEGVQLVEEVDEGLPDLSVDPPKLTQVLLNLAQNGLQAMRHGGTLTLRARRGELRDPKARRAPAIELLVEDTGTGIAPDDLDKLFVPFFTTRHDGTGLGLAISRRLVHAHGGELDVRSVWGKGSVFTVRLPLGIAEEQRAA